MPAQEVWTKEMDEALACVLMDHDATVKGSFAVKKYLDMWYPGSRSLHG